MMKQRPRLNSRQRARIYGKLVARDGERCQICGKEGSETTLQVDRIDGTRGYDNLHNLQLLCGSCNSGKDPRGKIRFELRRVRDTGDILNSKAASAAMERNMFSEPKLRQWVYRTVMKQGRLPLKDAVNAGAELAKCSQQTATRYIDKLCSFAGPCELTPKDENGVVWIVRRGGSATDDQVMEEMEDTKRMADEILSRDT